jgi:hypothetical protein
MIMLMQMQCNYGAKHLRCYSGGAGGGLLRWNDSLVINIIKKLAINKSKASK